MMGSDPQVPEHAVDVAAQRLRDFAELATEWFWEMDASLRFSFVSQKLEASAGVPFSAIAGRGLEQLPALTSRADLPAMLERHERFEDVGVVWRRSGAPALHLNVSGRPCFDAAGAFTGYRGIGRDVSESGHVSRDARLNEQKLRLLVDALPVCVAYLDHGLRYRLGNATFQRWFCNASEPFDGRTLESVLGPAAFAEVELAYECALQGETLMFDQTLAAEHGPARELQTTLVPHRTDAGEVLGLFVLSLDVSDQKRRGDQLALSLRYLSAALDGLDSALVVLDETGQIRSDNASWRLMASELTGQDAAGLHSYRDVCDRMLQGASKSNRAMVDAVERFARREAGAVRQQVACPSPAGPRWLSIVTSEFKEAGERFVLVAHDDVTERVLLAQRLRLQDTSIARAARLSSLGELAATMAHELNQPLTAIGNYAAFAASLLDRSGSSTGVSHDNALPLRNALERLVAEARRSGDIVHRLNRSVRQLPSPRETFDPQVLVEEVLLGYDSRGIGPGISLVPECVEPVPMLRADRIQLEQVLHNVIGNAIEAMSDAGAQGRVRVGVALVDGGKQIEFVVDDDGPGVCAELDSSIFEPFVSSKSAGLGLGLAICRSIVERHGGGIGCQPSDTGGASIRFVIPLEAEGSESGRALT